MSTQIIKTEELGITSFLKSNNISNKIEEILGSRKSTFVTSLVQIVNSNELLKNAEPQSILNAGLLATSLNLPLNNSLGHSYIVPFRNNKTGTTEAQFQIGYKGLQQLAMRTGLYLDIDAKLVYDGQYVEDDSFRGYHFEWKNKKSENVIGYTSYFRLKNGFESIYFMSKKDLEKHASKYSQTYKRGFGNWKDDFDKMGLKTVIKLNLNSGKAPLSIEMENAITADQSVINDYDGNTVDVSYVDNTESNIAKPTQSNIETERFKAFLSTKLNKDTVDSLSDEEIVSAKKVWEDIDVLTSAKEVKDYIKNKKFTQTEQLLIKSKHGEFESK